MSNLHRSQIYIEESQIYQLKLEAKKEHLTVSELIRRAIDIFLKMREDNVNWKKDPLYKAIGKIEFIDTDVSVNHDHYLYGQRS